MAHVTVCLSHREALALIAHVMTKSCDAEAWRREPDAATLMAVARRTAIGIAAVCDAKSEAVTVPAHEEQKPKRGRPAKPAGKIIEEMTRAELCADGRHQYTEGRCHFCGKKEPGEPELPGVTP